MSSLCVLLAFATFNDYFIHQMDVTSAFLYGELKKKFTSITPKVFSYLAMKEKYVVF